MLESSLQTSCELFIVQATTLLVGSLSAFLNKVPTHEPDRLPPFDNLENLQATLVALIETTHEGFDANMKKIHSSLKFFLDQSPTIDIILQPIIVNAIQAIDEFREYLISHQEAALHEISNDSKISGLRESLQGSITSL